ncbi:hypothetical protein OIU78_016816, partial [Salix suchowensis]
MEFVCEKGVGFVRIDGNTLASDRQNAVSSFQSSDKVKIAIIGIAALGVSDLISPLHKMLSSWSASVSIIDAS